MRSAILIASFILFINFYGYTQETNPDRVFYAAKELAVKGAYPAARSKANELLKIAPQYLDASILIARTFSWESKFDSARIVLNHVLQKSPDYTDAHSAFADIEYWAGNFTKALGYCDTALIQEPANKDILLQKVKILMALGRENEARQILSDLLKLNPYDYRVNLALQEMQRFKNRIIVEHALDYFSKPYHYLLQVTSLQYQRESSWGTWVAKANFGQMFIEKTNVSNQPQFQFEMDAYPKISDKEYLYFNYGYSWGELFPTHRVGAEYFYAPNTYDFSIGLRYLNHSKSSIQHTQILTGSVGKYFKNHWLSFRPYFIVNNNDISLSYYINYKNYLKGKNQYCGAALGYGISPDEVYTQNNTAFQVITQSYRLRLDYQWMPAERWIVRFMLGNSIERFNNTDYRYRFDSNIYVAWLF